jgi:NDP-sugar pyrophosphorylase family protein
VAKLKAMVLAAGLGTRLRPLTHDRPKALVDVAGRTMLEITLRRLQAFGVREVIVNVHHFADLVIDYLKAHDNFGMRIEVSREDTLLDTGGGLKKAAWFFLNEPAEPFLLHNVDIVSTFDLAALVSAHQQNEALATLAVQRRATSRLLLFDEDMQLRGRQGATENAETDGIPLAFAGIHIISPELLGVMPEDGAFSIIDAYLRLASTGQKIIGYRDDHAYWCDLGKPESVAKAAADMLSGVFSS